MVGPVVGEEDGDGDGAGVGKELMICCLACDILGMTLTSSTSTKLSASLTSVEPLS